MPHDDDLFDGEDDFFGEGGFDSLDALREEEESEDELDDTMDFGSFGDDEEGYDNDF